MDEKQQKNIDLVRARSTPSRKRAACCPMFVLVFASIAPHGRFTSDIVCYDRHGIK
jgi:hypothetical protein